MSAPVEGAVVLARIDASRWDLRDEAYREEVRAWLRVNGVDPNRVRVADVVVVVLDAPAILRREYVLDPAGRMRRDPDDPGAALTRDVHSLLRVPLPEHLADPA